jgi:hypothetical protein
VGQPANTGSSMSSTSWPTKLFWARVMGGTGCNYGCFFGTANVWGALAVEVARST